MLAMMNNAAIPSIFDTQSLASLKGGLRKDDPQALKAAARQFEAVFIQMVMKSMRAATPQDGMFDSDQTRFYQELLDSQLAQVMSAKGGTGLAAMIERQLARPANAVPVESGAAGLPLNPPAPELPLGPAQPKSFGVPEAEMLFQLRSMRERVPPRPRQPDAALPHSVSPASTSQVLPSGDSQAEAFGSALWPSAQNASRQTGIPPQFLLAQAALETGWGKYEPRTADGRQSYNLFGIKAGGTWSGPVAESTTTEYANGKAVRRVERFRAYGSYAEAFDDYARLLTTQPRYAAVLGTRDAASFARALQGAGYATDPAYADKLTRVIGGLQPGLLARG
jgi:flagellar protein FlgJ